MNSKFSDQKGSKALILQTLRIQGPISRIALTHFTGLSRATVSVSITELMEANLVRETENREFSGGRPATALELVDRSRAILGAELDNDTWTLGAFDLVGNLLREAKIPVGHMLPLTAMKELADGFHDFVQNLDITPIRLLGLGTPGLVDSDQGVIISAADLGWFNVEIGKMMTEEIGCPTVVLNRHRARGLSESRSSNERNYDTMIYLGIGSGIAAGLFHKGQLISGSLGGAGEVGHMTIEPNGAPCPCGNHGCLQLYASSMAIEQEARRLIRMSGISSASIFMPNGYDLQQLRAFDICKAAEQGDDIAVSVIHHAAAYLGIAMGNIVNLFNPDVIILGGPLPALSQLYVQTATDVMRQRAMSPLGAKTVVHTSSYSQIGGAWGAANFALDRHMSYSLFS
jgi:predicted NBD/HSP70 family sugar kinase